MKKTIATCLLLILILSCVFSFVACSDPVDPIVGKYKSYQFSNTYNAYLEIFADGTAIRYTVYKDTGTLNDREDYTWEFNKERNTYIFTAPYYVSPRLSEFILSADSLKYPNDEKEYQYIKISNEDWLK